ncbi:MAG: SPFH domain-containing protein [Oscillospiraceae bacterium]|nr:SPFH domain-containing protein [Oscillospiraceae bacterium]
MALIDVIKFDGLATRDWLIYKHPSENLTTGSQLVVAEGQAVIFMKKGQICDIFDPGTHTLSTQNLPILQRVVNIPFGGKTPFTAEIFYLNTVTRLNVHWGTSDPVSIIDPKYSTRLRIRAFGQMGLKLKDYGVFLRELIGVMKPSEMIQFDNILEYFRGVIVQRIKVLIADIIVNEKISALEITPRLDEISESMRTRIEHNFDQYGMEVANFYIKSINFPDEDFEAINAVLHKRAEFDLIGDARYATARSFDVYETAAGNSSGIAGAFVAGGVGLGAGAALGGQMSQVMANTAPNGVICPGCNTNNAAGVKFCSNCGNDLTKPKVEAMTTKCPHCNSDVPESAKFCNHCGKSVEPPKCKNCSNLLAPGTKFCNQCGTEVTL